MSNKMLLKEKVLTSGNGQERVVLDYDANLVYAYHNPEDVIAYFEPKKGWIIRNRPYYSSGGWGRGSSGNRYGYALVSNARSLLDSIEATVYEVNSMKFLTDAETKSLQKQIRNHNKLVASQNALAEKLGETRTTVDTLKPIPEFTLRLLHKRTSLKGNNLIDTALTYKDAVQVFLNKKGRAVKVDCYTIKPNLVLQNKTVVAFRDAMGEVFMNSAVLDITIFEREFMGKQSLIQAEIRKVSKYNIPFNVLASANLKLSETKVIEAGPASTHIITNNYKKEERHFTGALLLENAGRKFLMDIDRREIEHGIFNAFFVEVSSHVKSIAEAYDSMVPEAVKKAIADGIEVQRQGEWFFIATDKVLTLHKDKVLRWDSSKEATQVRGQYRLLLH